MTAVDSSTVVEQLEPRAVWRFFAGIAATPRPSKREDQIRAHIRERVRQLGFSCHEDHVGNIVTNVPASPGCEHAPITVLQAHLDMVCEKNAAVQHDFDRDPIHLLLDKDSRGAPIVRADGTTLGADNGIGVALALAAASEPDIVHGPLEILLTVDEEAGMTGANAVTPELFRGRLLLNLDSEEDDVLYIGCAGGCDANLTWEFTKSAAGDQEHARVTVSGLRGGHSGGDIHENRANANKLLVRTLLGAGCDNLRLCTIAGGSKRNAIPREAHAEICVPQGLIHALRQSAERVCAETRAESGESNPSIRVEPPTKPAGPAASPADTTRLLRALAAIPSGVLGMHPKATDLVETSNNLSTIASSSDGPADLLRITAGTLTRSSCESRLDEVLQQIEAVGRLSGAKITTANRYPGWDPDPDAPLVGICRRVYAKQFGAPPKVAAIHAGLECGIIGRQVKPIQMISFGPRIAGAHSPDECVWVESVAKVWRYLQAVLKSVAEPERHSEKKDGEAVNIGSISRRPKC